MEPLLRFKADDGSKFPKWEEHNLSMRVFDSLIDRKSPAGRLMPALFLSTFLFYYMVFCGIICYTNKG